MTDRYESRAATHADDCWSWGPRHYDCAVREIERLRKMHRDAYQRGLQAGSRGLREAHDAVQEVKRQDAWDNTRLTEALMAAEERAERAEAENKHLREQLRLATVDQATAEAEANDALESAREDAWQPIETAPRDGTTVVVYFKGHGAMTVAWEDPWGDGPKAATWCVTDHKHGPYPVRGYRTGDDTHWRPLPAPPTIDQARGKGWKEGSND